jgi:hypothetical protein
MKKRMINLLKIKTIVLISCLCEYGCYDYNLFASSCKTSMIINQNHTDDFIAIKGIKINQPSIVIDASII